MTDAVLSPDAPRPDAPTPDTVTEQSGAVSAIEAVREALDGARIVMFTAVHEGLHSRPLTLLRIDDTCGLWFLVDGGEEWVQALVDRPMVDVSADLHTEGRWVSVSGVAVLSDDRTAIKELWTPAGAAFWESEDDASIRVLRVDPTVVDVWRTAPSAIGRVLAIGKAMLTGEHDDVGGHDHYVLNSI